VNLECNEGQQSACLCSPALQFVQLIDAKSLDHYENHKPAQISNGDDVNFIDSSMGQSEQVYEMIDDTKINLINTDRLANASASTNKSDKNLTFKPNENTMSTSTFKKKYPKTNPNYVKVNKLFILKAFILHSRTVP
jgi:hypothetical protein